MLTQDSKFQLKTHYLYSTKYNQRLKELQRLNIFIKKRLNIKLL